MTGCYLASRHWSDKSLFARLIFTIIPINFLQFQQTRIPPFHRLPSVYAFRY